ncbi:MAG: hypothetical protein GY796_14935 [Chloroflexi bacterium]|nr:hypothetical protein [Chloroflexota bacterium]
MRDLISNIFMKETTLIHQHRAKWLMVAVLLLAAVFRLVALQDMPPGLSQDEVLNAGMPAFILQGNVVLFFRQGYGHEPLFHYLTVPFYWFLGENYLQVRLPSVFLGLLLVAATMRWAKREFGALTAVVAGLGLAVSWWSVIFSRVGIRPIMMPLFWVGAAWFWQKRPWLAGLLLGLSLYTYTGAQVVFVWPLLMGAGWLILSNNRRERRMAVRQNGAILAAAGLAALPLYLTLLADPTLLQRVSQLDGPLAVLRAGDGRPLLQATLATLGVFSFTGDPRWTYMLPGRPLFDPLTALFFYAGVVIAFLRIRQQPKYVLLLAWLLVGLLPSMLTPQAPSAIRMIGALPPVFVLIGLSVAVIGRRSRNTDNGIRMMIYGLLLFLLLLNIGRTIQVGRAWSTAVETRLNHYQTTLLEIVRHWQADPVSRVVVTDTFFEPIDAESLARNGGAEMAARWQQAGSNAAGAIVFPAGKEDGRLYVPEYVPLPSMLQTAAGISPEPDWRSQTNPAFAVYTLPAALNPPPLAETVTFGEMITLKGYKILPWEEGQPLPLLTYWQVEKPLPWNLTLFAHLLDESNELAAQFDGFDAAPATLQPGDSFMQLHLIPVPEVFHTGTVQIGLYTPHDNKRLTHLGETLDVVIIPLTLKQNH